EANGVIVVTTKKGQKGKMKINFNASTFITTKPDFDKLNLMNSSEKVDFELYMAQRGDMYNRTDILRGDIARILNTNGDLSKYQSLGWDGLSSASQNSINALRNNNTNWFDESYQTAINQQYGLSLSGGNELATYYVSAGYYDEQGTTRGTGFNRFNLTSNLDFKITDKINFGIGLFGNQNKRTSYMSDTDAHTNPARYTRNVNPYRTLYNEDGSYSYDPDIDHVDDKLLNYNLAEERENTSYELNNTALKALFSLDYRILRGLKFNTQFGMEVAKTGTEKLAKENSFYRRKYREYSSYQGDKYMLEDKGGIIQNWNESFFQYNWKAQLEYSRTFAEKHDMDLMGGVELRRNETEIIHTKGFGFNEKTLETQSLTFPTTTLANDPRFRQYQKSFVENAFVSYYGTASYTYDNRYTVFGSIRFDGSDLFGADPKYRYLPLWSASGAWNINREAFLEDVAWLSNLKLRASYGLQGNIDKNTRPFVVGDWKENQILPGQNEDMIIVTTPPNQNLRWEKTGTTNIGLDFGVLNNRISGSIEGYYRNSTDLIGIHELSQENGFEFTSMNWARVTNRGFEVTLSTRNIITKNFSWSTDFNFSRNKSKVNDIHVQENSNEPSLKGYPVNALFNIKTAGLDERGVPQFYNKEGEIVSLEERFKLSSMDFGNGPELIFSDLTNSEYRDLYQYAGDKDPKFSGGFINKFRYKNFDLNISASFNLKQMVQATPSYTVGQIDAGVNYTRDVLNAWSPQNTGSSLPALIGSTGDTAVPYLWYNNFDSFNSYRRLDIWSKEISYLRINSIRLGYTLPASVLKGKFIESCRFNVEARNPFVFGTNYDGYFDPETYGNIYAQPISKSFSLGVNMTF
ncbi:MAG: SusC/RagA family TonB-linked outer membrane protein, partial [Bacteroidales bacterium]